MANIIFAYTYHGKQGRENSLVPVLHVLPHGAEQFAETMDSHICKYRVA